MPVPAKAKDGSAASADWAKRIAEAWRKSLVSVLEAGQLLIEAKAALSHGAFTAMIDGDLPFGSSTAQRLMAISRDQRLVNPAHVQHLPPHWGTLYELTKLDDRQFEDRLNDGTIRPDMDRKTIANQVKASNRAKKEADLGAKQRALPDKKYGVIYADPEWKFETWSENGQDRAAANHYMVNATSEIMKREVGQIAADDCVLFLWAIAPMLPDGIDVLRAWGFDYKSHAIWRKPTIITGYWFRFDHELLLVGTRGNIPAPAMGTQPNSVIDAVIDERVHSRKPERFYEIIEGYFPNLPKIELNARRARPGWDAWGNEAPQ